MTGAPTWRLAWHRAGPAAFHEHCTLEVRSSGLSMTGTVLGAEHDLPVRVDYSVATDDAGFTTAVHVTDQQGFQRRSVNLTRDSSGTWTLAGSHAVDLEGCTDIDLGCSPSTNALPVRRLGLRVSESRTVQVAWLRFPQLTVHRVCQTYTRLDTSRYRYASGAFEADLFVDDDDLVVRFAEWRRIAIVRGSGPMP
jgi:hypothetical protein